MSGAFDTTKRAGTPAGNRASFVPLGDPSAEIVVQAPPGVRLSTSVGSAWNEGAKTLTVRSGTTVYAHAVQTGTHSLQFTEGAETVSAQFRVTTVAAAAYNITLLPPPDPFKPLSEGRIEARITDVFGNPVPGSAPSDEVDNSVDVSASGEVLLSGYSTRDTIEFDANGKSDFGVVTGARGSAYLSAMPSARSNVPAWQPGYAPPLGAPPPAIDPRLKLAIGAVAPSPPTGLQATAVPGGVKVSWQGPKNSGSTPVESYSVTASPGGYSCTAKVLTCTLEGLTLGQQYSLTVTAENFEIASAPSEALLFLYELTRPSPPTDLTVVPGDGRALASWSEPRDLGGLPVRQYSVTATPGEHRCFTSGLDDMSCTITGLDNLTRYTFVAVATNDVGESEPSDPVGPITPGAPPSPPQGLTVVGQKFVKKGDDLYVAVTVSFRPPTSSGDAPVASYRIGTRNRGIEYWGGSCQTAELRCTVRISPGDTEAIIVAASNKFGQSEPSQAKQVTALTYKVVAQGRGPRSAVASSLFRGAFFAVSWVVRDPQHMLTSYDFDLDLTGAVYSSTSLGTRHPLNRSSSVRKSKGGWVVSLSLAYTRMDRALCYLHQYGLQNGVAIDLDSNQSFRGFRVPGPSWVRWPVRCSDW